MTRCKIEADERQLSRQLAERRADLLQLAPEERAAFLKAARSDWLLARGPQIVDHALHRRVLNHDRGSAGLVGSVGAQLVKDALLRLSNYSVVKVDLSGVGAQWMVFHRSDLLEHGVEVGERAGSPDTGEGCLEVQVGRPGPMGLERHRSGHAVHRPGKDVEAVKVRASVSMDSQGVRPGRGTVERPRVGHDRGRKFADGVASGRSATGGLTAIPEGSTRPGWRRCGGTGHPKQRQNRDECELYEANV
jgi:hypothetical protein